MVGDFILALLFVFFVLPILIYIAVTCAAGFGAFLTSPILILSSILEKYGFKKSALAIENTARLLLGLFFILCILTFIILVAWNL